MIQGVLNIYKEAGWTSHDVVAKLRRIVGQKKIGHTGTLDPDAVGVLPVCLGNATKLCGMLTEERKTYRAVLRLGAVTDTQDMSGKLLEEHPVEVSPEEIRACLASFEGEQLQVPPMYSALKVNGKKLYELAREGKTVERRARPVTFYRIALLEAELPRLTLEVVCSKGTYIRTLCHDIGQRLGCGGAMEHLTRTRVGRFAIEDALTLAKAEELARLGALEERLVTAAQMFSHLPGLTAEPGCDRLVHNGNPVSGERLVCIDPVPAEPAPAGEAAKEERKEQPEELFRLFDSQGAFVGVYAFDRDRNLYRPRKMFL